MDVMRIANKCTAVAKNELFYAGPYGLGIWLCGTIFIPRTDRVKAQKLMEDSIQKILQEKVDILKKSSVPYISFYFISLLNFSLINNNNLLNSRKYRQVLLRPFLKLKCF